VAESAVDPPGPIPNPIVTHRSAGEYSGGDPMGGEAAAGAPRTDPPLCGVRFARRDAWQRDVVNTAGWSSGSSLGS
jgi:hypothetical protein